MEFDVKYSDNFGCEEIFHFTNEEEAERFIKKELNSMKECFETKNFHYDYGNFGVISTEIWEIDGNHFMAWERLWK